jgi:hypothetical protein
VFKGWLTFPDVKGDEEVAVKTLHSESDYSITHLTCWNQNDMPLPPV